MRLKLSRQAMRTRASEMNLKLGNCCCCRSNAAGLLLVATALIITLAATTSDAWLFDGFSRPFRSAYSKARNFRDRTLTSRWTEPRARLKGRSAGPSMVADSAGRVSSPRDDEPAPEPEQNESSDFRSRCFLARGPNFNKPPKLFFYSTKKHAPDSRGCQTNKTEQFEMKLAEGDETSETPALDFEFIRRELLDSGLFEAGAPTYFVIHGFMASWNSDNWMCAVKDLVLDSTPANVFIVDWSGGSKPMLPIDYSASVSNTQYVGRMLGQFISGLLELTGQNDASQFHLIGHSLGAHICGFAGYYVRTIGRITALDPAGPCFTSDTGGTQTLASDSGHLGQGKRRLSPESANFVVALHTDISLFGLDENCAHYDVYVNGGTSQPGCSATSLTGRFEDLIKLNIKDSFDLNLGCSHSYSHELLDTFVNFVRAQDARLAPATRQKRDVAPNSRRLLVTGPSNGANTSPSDRCYAIAYECANWDAFKAGECAFCRDNDARCVFTGLSLFQYQTKRELDPNSEPDWANSIDTSYRLQRPSNDDDDDQFNDEDGDTDEPNRPSAEPAQPRPRPSTRFSQGQHFMRSGSTHEPCLYHYQIIVAARRSQLMAVQDSGKYYFYLHLPLEYSGLLIDANGKRLQDRLVQVSHRLEHASPTFEHIQSAYLEALNERGFPLDESLRDDVEFYTALITFKQAPHEACEDSVTNGARRKDSWQICRPLANIQEARLWSSSEQKLDSVAWVALNYMSGLSYDIRMSYSYAFERDPSEGLKSRDELDNSSRPELSELSPKRRSSFDSFVQGASNSAQCLLSVFDMSQKRTARTNFKCNRSGRELKYAIKLAPSKLGQAQQ